ncbi:hypothetical protein [Prescottella equi]|uniref:hypothetical protein n=1 Tax=Rhodococcus hoagii TaxID=43767 RepID=UPI00111BFD71|nr:hypothetical protein [Prescottella equi]
MSTAEQIIAEHRFDDVSPGLEFCTCGWGGESHAAHVVAALTNAGKTIVGDVREEWSHRNSNGGASFHPTRESAEAEQAAWERERREGGGYRRLGPSMPPSDGIYRRTVTEWEPAAARVAEGGDQP